MLATLQHGGMIKSKFGQRLRSKSLRAQINEALCKVLCPQPERPDSISHELGIETTFGAETAFASKPMSI